MGVGILGVDIWEVDIFGADVLGADVLGVDILGVDILRLTLMHNTTLDPPWGSQTTVMIILTVRLIPRLHTHPGNEVTDS